MAASIDITQHKFGRLTALCRAPKRDRRTHWVCVCSCGRTIEVVLDNLRNGHTRSCGCLAQAGKPPKENLKGKIFGLLAVQRFESRYQGGGDALWACVCACGNRTKVRGSHLKSGASRSCGCQIKKALKRVNTTHGKYGTPEYRVWAGMRTRCYNTKEYSYRYYGGRGIRICKRWMGPKGFTNFLADMGPRPSAKYSIDRIKVNGHYSPKNCQWATNTQQSYNKRTTLRVTHAGQKMPLKTACDMLGVSYYSVRLRVLRGMSFSDAVTKPFRRRSNVVARLDQGEARTG